MANRRSSEAANNHATRNTQYVIRNFILSKAEGTPHTSVRSLPVGRFTHHAFSFLSRFDAGLLIAALLTLFIIQNLLQPGLPAGADLPIHLYRTMEYERAWAPGVIVPRWAPNLAFGYGYPLYVFAPPLPYLLGMFFHLTGFTFETALKLLIILTILLYAIGMYLLGRDLLGSVEAGLVAATAYAFAPFALREAILYGGNVPQFLAIGLFPWTLWAMTRTVFSRAWGWVILAAVFYAGVVLSHLFHTLVFAPVVGFYGLLLLWLSAKTVRQALRNPTTYPATTAGAGRRGITALISSVSGRSNRLIVGILPLFTVPLGLLLSAFFWMPAFTERFYTRAQADIYLEKSPFFVRYPHWTELVAWIYPLDARAANPYVPLTLSVATLALAALGLLAGLWLGVKPQKPTNDNPAADRQPSIVPFILFFAVIAATATFLVLPVSRPVWDAVTILQVAEFPWRLLGIANLGLAFLAGAALLLLPLKFRRPAAALCLVLQIGVVAPYLYPVLPFARYGHSTISDQINYEHRAQSVGTTGLSEYLPQTVSQPPTGSPMVKPFKAGQNPERLDRDSLPDGATATLLKQNAVTHVYRLNSPTNFTLRFLHYHYPGWRVQLDDHEIEVKPEDETGLMIVDIPAGQHTLIVHFGEIPGRVVAMSLTGLTVAGLVIAGVYVRRKSPRKHSDDNQGWRLTADSPLGGIKTLGVAALIIAGALWLKPLLRPVLTVQSPPGQALPARHKVDINFANGIRLIGYDLDRPVVSPGERLQIVLYWETDVVPIKANLQPFVHLDRLNDFTTIADATNYVPGNTTTEIEMPTFHWDNVRYVRDEHDLTLPLDTPPIAYAVRAGMLDPDQNQLLPLADDQGDTALLTVINVSPAAGQQIRPAEPLDISFSNTDDAIRLTGFELNALTPEQLDFTLAWQSNKTPRQDYTVFAQLLDENQNLVAGFDHPPLDGAYPTSTWLPAQIIIDPRSIPLGDIPPGHYRLIVGLYNPVTQERLTTNSGTDFVELSELQLTGNKE